MKKPIRYLLPLIIVLLLVALILTHTFRSIFDTDIHMVTVSSDSPLKAYRLNINTATAEDLCTLPGIGPALAEKIIAYREQNGPFRATRDLLLVSGIGPKVFNAIEDLITVR